MKAVNYLGRQYTLSFLLDLLYKQVYIEIDRASKENVAVVDHIFVHMCLKVNNRFPEEPIDQVDVGSIYEFLEFDQHINGHFCIDWHQQVALSAHVPNNVDPHESIRLGGLPSQITYCIL